MSNRRRKMDNFLSTDIYGITAEEYSLGRGNIETARLMIEAGIKVLQYREKNKSAKTMFEECVAIRELTSRAGATFIVNDRADIAAAVRADGVHVGQDDLPPERAREIVGKDAIVGLSTHSPEQARAADKLGEAGIVDYIGVGPLFATKTKVDVMDPVGLEYLDYVVANISIPFVAIGGVKEHNVGSVRSRGAKIICLVTEIVGASDIAAKVDAIRRTIRAASI